MPFVEAQYACGHRVTRRWSRRSVAETPEEAAGWVERAKERTCEACRKAAYQRQSESWKRKGPRFEAFERQKHMLEVLGI